MRKTLLFVLLGLSTTTFAETSTEKLQVLKTVKNFAQSIACETSFEGGATDKPTTLKDVYSLDDGYYLVNWSGDVGCNGGTGTMSNHFTPVERLSDSRPFLVNLENSLDAFGLDNELAYSKAEAKGVSNINFRFIDSVKKLNNSTFEIISLTFADKQFGGNPDAGDGFPPNKIKFVVKNIDGHWKITNRTLISQEK